MQPDVSVVIPVWNGEAFIGGAVRSALAQEDVAVEVIVVDDASSDSSVRIVEAIDDSRIRIVRHARNAGPGAARNTAFREASGRWLAVLDADDTMQPGRLRHLIGLAEKDAVDIVADNLLLLPAGTPMFDAGAFPSDGFLDLGHLVRSDRLFTRRWTLGYLKPLFRRDLVSGHGLAYRPEVKIGEDFIFLADCLAVSPRMRVDPVARYNYLVREGSASARTQQSHVEQMLRVQAEFADRHNLRPEWGEALAERRRNLEAAKAYLDMVDQVKAWRLGAALTTAVAHPRGAALFRLPIAARLRRIFSLLRAGNRK